MDKNKYIKFVCLPLGQYHINHLQLIYQKISNKIKYSGAENFLNICKKISNVNAKKGNIFFLAFMHFWNCSNYLNIM